MGDEATNLIVECPGTKRADEIVLLGAHYDTVFSTPGADDNASAVAVMLEVSRLLRDHTGKRTARYVAFACEEPPYFNMDSMGSQHHARQSRQRGDNIVGMLCLEMVGYYSLTKGSQTIPPGDSEMAAPILSATRQLSGRRRQHAVVEVVLAIPPRIQTRHTPDATVLDLPPREDPRDPSERQQLVLGPRLSRPDAHRHQLLAQSELPPSHRHTRHARLSPHDRSHPRRRIRDATNCWDKLTHEPTDIPSPSSHSIQ